MTQDIKINKGYLIETSIGVNVKIDEEELPKALEIWKTGKIGQFKQGFVRGDLIGCIVEDKERMLDSVLSEKVRSINNIFKDVKLLPNNQEPKQIEF